MSQSLWTMRQTAFCAVPVFFRKLNLSFLSNVFRVQNYKIILHLINQFHNFVGIFEENINLNIMNSVLKKVLTYFILPLIIVGLTWAIVRSVMEPVNFNKHRAYRESIAIQRLKDIRDLQVAYKNVNGKYASTLDSLKMFYNDGKMKLIMQVGSKDDSLAMAHTNQLKNKYRYLKGEKLAEKLNELYLAGDENLVFQITREIPVKDTLFKSRTDFNVDSLAFIPFSGDSVILASTIKTVSGVKVPLFEASMPFRSLLKGLDNQLRINLDAEREDQGRYQGLQVGSISAPNNNAGNWE